MICSQLQIINIILGVMFLSKKNAIFFNKPKGGDLKKPSRVLTGWQEQEQQPQQTYEYVQKNESRPSPSSLLLGEEYTDLTAERQQRKQVREKFYLNWDELDAKDDIECEKRLIEEIVQPGGIRVKPNDNMLSELLKEVKGMDVHIIASLLLSKLEVNYNFQVKAKALYTIEFLVKKNQKFLSYFKAHVDKLSQFPQPEDNVENYRKILKVVLNFIGISNPVPFEQEESRQVFVDPGYNDDPRSKISNFIQQNANKTKKVEQKKAIIGPGQLKQKLPEKAQQQKSQLIGNDFFSLDLLGTGTGSIPPQGQNANQMSFDLMMGGSVPAIGRQNQNSNANLLI